MEDVIVMRFIFKYQILPGEVPATPPQNRHMGGPQWVNLKSTARTDVGDFRLRQ